MKRFIAFVLAICLCWVCLSAAAEDPSRIVNVNLETATDEELEAAAALIKAVQKARLKTFIRLDITEIALNKGSSQKVAAEVVDVPEGVTAGKLAWSSSDEKVATCSNGTVKITGAGKATVTCSSFLSDGTEITAEIAVTGLLPIQSISLGSAKMDVMAGDVFMPEVIFKPEDASNKNVVLSSSDEKVVRVDENGQLVAVMEGKAVVTVTTADGSKKTAKLNVNVTRKVGKYDDELTFQGLAWDIDVKTAYDNLTSLGFVEEQKNVRAYKIFTGNFWPENDLFFASPNIWYNIPVVFADKGLGAASLSITPLKTIGGYTPQWVDMYFLNGLTADGNVDPDKTELSSVYIRYDNKHEPGAEIFVDLLAKLEAQYGEFTRYISKQLGNKEIYDAIKTTMKGAKQYERGEFGRDIPLSPCAICILRGKHNTGIMLMIDQSANVILFYGKTDAQNRIKAIQEILESEPDNKEDAGI